MTNWPLPGSVKIKDTRHCGATACDNYTFMYPVQKNLRLSEVRNGTRGQTMILYQNIRFEPPATRGGLMWKLKPCTFIWKYNITINACCRQWIIICQEIKAGVWERAGTVELLQIPLYKRAVVPTVKQMG